MKILVTGGTGFLGRRIVSELAPRHDLRLLVRPKASRERFPAGVEFAPGDVTDRASLDKAMDGCDATPPSIMAIRVPVPTAGDAASAAATGSNAPPAGS